jgi:opacity protein-like surface antigen
VKAAAAAIVAIVLLWPAPSHAQGMRQSDEAMTVQVFGNAGLVTWTSRETFKAIFGTSVGPMIGGGARLTLRRHLFLEASVDHFRKTGQRVFVHDGEVFKLGIKDTVTIVPILASAGLRFGIGGASELYLGGGAGYHLLRERSEFSDGEESAREQSVGSQLVGGMETSVSDHLNLATEVRWTRVPNAFGDNGAAAALGQTDLGGTTLRVKAAYIF